MKTLGLGLPMIVMLGCSLGSSDGSAGEPELDSGFGGTGAGGTGWAGGGGDAGMNTPLAFEAFELPIRQSVTIGAFVLEVETARVAPGENFYGPSAEIDVDFSATNASTSLETPLAGYSFGDGMLLDVGGAFFYGDASADPVPGLRSGKGSMHWSVAINDVTVEALRTATIAIGYADENQVVIPLADPTSTIAMNDVDVAASFTISDFRQATVEIDSVRVQFNDREGNTLLPRGTAVMVLTGALTAYGGAYWGAESAFLERPDGISVPVQGLNAAPRGREEVTLVFELEEPYSGTYIFGVFDPAEGTVTREIIVP